MKIGGQVVGKFVLTNVLAKRAIQLENRAKRRLELENKNALTKAMEEMEAGLITITDRPADPTPQPSETTAESE